MCHPWYPTLIELRLVDGLLGYLVCCWLVDLGSGIIKWPDIAQRNPPMSIPKGKFTITKRVVLDIGQASEHCPNPAEVGSMVGAKTKVQCLQWGRLAVGGMRRFSSPKPHDSALPLIKDGHHLHLLARARLDKS